MSIHFMLSQRSLKLSLFLFFFSFFCSAWVFSHTVFQMAGPVPLSHLSYCWCLSVFFVFVFISVMVLFRFSLCSSILLQSLMSIFMTITFNFLLGRLLISNLFSSISEVVSHSLIWTYSSLFLFCLILWVYFCFLGRWVVSQSSRSDLL